MRSVAPIPYTEAPEKIHVELTNIVLEAAGQVFAKSASNFEKAIASRILNKECGNFNVLTIDDFLADIICDKGRWKEYKKRIRHLGYMVELAPLALYILIEDHRLEDAKELFDLVSKTESTMQQHKFTDFYVEIMNWVAKKLNLNYSPPKSYIKSPKEYFDIIRAVLNYDEISGIHEILRAKYNAKRKIRDMFFEGEEAWDVRLLYFAWKLSILFSLPIIPSRELGACIESCYRKRWIIYRLLWHIPEIIVFAITIIIATLVSLVQATPGFIAVVILILKGLWVKYLPEVIQRLVKRIINRWSYFNKTKMELERYKQLREQLRRLGL